MSQMQWRFYEQLLNHLLRELVADIKLSDNSLAIQNASQLSDLCQAVEFSLLGGWIKNTSQAYLEVEVNFKKIIKNEYYIVSSSTNS